MSAWSRRRWGIAGLLCAASILNYLDRQTLSILAPTIQRELAMTDADYATVVNLFLLAYTFSSLASGWVVDRLGVRVSLALFVGTWSVANAFTGLARSVTSLGAFRFLLGLGEAGNWTAAPKAVAAWFPAQERAFAIGLYTLGATLGATLAPILVIEMAARGGWAAAFWVTGGLGLLWLIPWWWLSGSAATPSASDATEVTTVVAPVVVASTEPSWRVLADGKIWRLTVARLLTDPVWYFFQFWFAKYLHEDRGLDQNALAVSWVVYLAADVGVLAGGWWSGRLVAGGMTPVSGRLRTMLVCASLVPVAALIPGVAPLWLVLGLGMVAVFGHLAWLVNVSALVVDVTPRAHLGLTFGVVATGSALGGMAMNQVVAALAQRHAYAFAFLAMLVAHPIAWWLLRPLRRPATEVGERVHQTAG
jgi:ACS family hexuronate transporter-like MFS transporter